MKIKNYIKGNYRYCGEGVMYGEIKMTSHEFVEVIEYLKIAYHSAQMTCETYTRDSLAHVFDYSLREAQIEKDIPMSMPVCLGVCATEIIFKKYNLPRYKRQNYQIIITK